MFSGIVYENVNFNGFYMHKMTGLPRKAIQTNLKYTPAIRSASPEISKMLGENGTCLSVCESVDIYYNTIYFHSSIFLFCLIVIAS